MDRGRSSPSFLIAVALVVLTGAGYVGWRIWRPNPSRESERVVRQFAKEAGREIGALRRALRKLKVEGKASVAAIDRRAAEVRKALEGRAEAARTRIENIEDLGWRTLRNREGRIDKRLAETEQFLKEVVADAKSGLKEGTSGTGPAAR